MKQPKGDPPNAVGYVRAAKLLKKRVLIGAAERVDLPDLGVFGLRAKIDTGARSSAIHVEDLERLGEGRVRFRIPLTMADDGLSVWADAEVVRRSRVRPSSGVEQKRVFVKTAIRMGELEREIELSLAARGPMRYRLLLGRTALGRSVIIDPSRRYLATAREGSLRVKSAHRGPNHERLEGGDESAS